MVNALAQLTCSNCSQGFAEIIEKKKDKQSDSGVDGVDEQKKRANEQYRIKFDEGGQRLIQNIEGSG